MIGNKTAWIDMLIIVGLYVLKYQFQHHEGCRSHTRMLQLGYAVCPNCFPSLHPAADA